MINFYDIGFSQKRGEIFIEIPQEYDEQALRMGKLQVKEPLEVVVSEGKKFYDVIRFQDPFNFAISERFHTLLKESNLTGWKTFDLKIKNREEKYYGFCVTATSGALKRSDKKGFIIGLDFEYDKEELEDFFHPLDTMTLICTQKAKDFLVKHKISNIECINTREVEWYST